MDNTLQKRRNPTLDVIRIFALYTVVSVHFFLRTKFYSVTYDGTGPIESIIKAITEHDSQQLFGLWMFIAFMMRTFFDICVPLFILLTGYLMGSKTLSKKYYKGIRKTIIIFVLASVAHFFFKAFHDDALVKAALDTGTFSDVVNAFIKSDTLDLKHLILGTLNFKLANYSWYIEMYIGLFLMIPFLNLGYNKLKSRRQKQVLVLTFVLLTTLPSLFNIYNFDTAQWWLDPRSSDEYQKLIPSFWTGIYPITYYYTGMYLREYGLKPKTGSLFGILGVSLLLGTCFNLYRSKGGGFITGTYNYWGGIISYVLSIVTFTILSRIKSDNWNVKVKTGLQKVSDLVLGAFLMSKISDTIIYDDILAKNVPTFIERFPYYIITVPLSMLMALIFSYVLDAIYKGIIILYEKIKALIISKTKKKPEAA